MSETTDNPSAAPAPADPPKPQELKKPKKPGRWRRRFTVALVTLVAVVLIFRILLTLLLPWTVRRVANVYGLDCTFERADIYLTSGDAGLWHVKVTQLDNNQTVAEADYCRADISLMRLFTGQLVVQRLEADGFDLTIQRNADGTVPLLAKVLTGPTQPQAPKKASDKPSRLDLSPPVAIDAVVLTHIQAHIIDQAVQPPLDTRVEMNLRFYDLASQVRPARLRLEVLPAELMDSLSLDAEGSSNATKLDAKFKFAARGLHPSPIAGYLAPFGVRATADGLSVRAEGTINTTVIPGTTDALKGQIQFRDLGLSADGEPAATLPALTIDLDSVKPGAVDVGRVSVEGGTFLARRTTEGNLRVAGLEFASAQTSPGADRLLTPTLSPEYGSTALTAGRGEGTKAKALASADNDAGSASRTEKRNPASSANPPSQPAASASPALRYTVGELSVKNFRAKFVDQGLTTPTELQFVIEDISVKGLIADTSNPDAKATIAGRFSAPGVAGPILISGDCRPFAAKKTVALKTEIDNVRPDALRAYFDILGIQSDLHSGTLKCNLTADVTTLAGGSSIANARMMDVKWEDGKELLSLHDVNITGLALAPGSIHVDSVEVAGPRLSARREASGALWAAGFRLLPPSTVVKSSPAALSAMHPAPRAPAPASRPSPASQLAQLPRLDIGRFTWNGVQLQLDDQSPDSATSVTIQDAGVELTGIHVDFDPKAPPAAPGKIHAWLKAPGLAGDIELNGTLNQLPGGLSTDLEITGDHLSATLAAPYLKALNVEPTLRDGALHANAHIDLVQNETDTRANVTVKQVQFSDAGEEMLGIDNASITEVEMREGLVQIGAVTLDKPRGKIIHEENGALRVGGIRLVPKPPAPKKSAFASVTPTQPAGSAPRTVKATTQPAVAQTNPTSLAEVFILKKLTIQDASFALTDRAVSPPAEIVTHITGGISDVTWAPSSGDAGRDLSRRDAPGGINPALQGPNTPPRPAQITLTVKADGIVDEVKINGTATANESSADMSLAVSGTGLRQGALASYLPPGTSIDLKDGRFNLNLQAGIALLGEDGLRGNMSVTHVDYRDGEKGNTLLHLDSAKVAISRLDLPDIVALDEISIAGAESTARQTADGALHVMGISLASAPRPATQPTSRPAIATTALPPATQPTTGQSSPHPVPSGPLVIAKRIYPLIKLGKVDVNLRHFTLTDESRPAAAPVAISDLHVFARKPIVVLGHDPSAHPASDVALEMRIDHVMDKLSLTAQAAPFSSQPTFQFDLAATGIHGDGLLAMVPELKETIDASKPASGRLLAHGEAQMKLDRLDPLDFSLDRGFDADFLVKGVEYRSEASDELLAGVDEIRSDGVRVRPKSRSLLIKTLEINKLSARVVRNNEGLEALGLLVKIPQAQQVSTTQPSPAKPAGPTTASAVAATTKPARAVSATQPAEPSTDTPEIRINKLVLSGIDVDVKDVRVSPPLDIVLNQLDVDVRELSTRALVEDRPIRFSALIGAGDVELPRRQQHGMGGAVKDVAALIGGQKVETNLGTEKRPLFSQIEAVGTLSLFPKPKGRVKATVSAFDLASLKSEVKEANVNLANGVFDTNIDVLLPGDGTMAVHSNYVFTDLELSEPANGPIVRYLQLNAPLDVVIGALQDQDGSIDVPLALNIKDGHISGSEVAGAAINAFGAIVVKAVAAAPIKTASAATDLASAIIPGLGGDKAPKKEEPVILTFGPGDDSLSPSDQQSLAALIKRMQRSPNLDITLRHQLGAQDISRATLRANPNPQDCRALLDRLTRRRQQLRRARAEWSARARGDLASRSPADAAATVESLQATERELASTEDSIDRVYDLMRPGADRQSDRRTRQAALEIGQTRLMSIRSAMLAAGITPIDDRVHITRPQFNPTDGTTGGKIEITLTVKKKS